MKMSQRKLQTMFFMFSTDKRMSEMTSSKEEWSLEEVKKYRNMEYMRDSYCEQTFNCSWDELREKAFPKKNKK